MPTFIPKSAVTAICCAVMLFSQAHARVLSETVVGDVAPETAPIVSEQRQQKEVVSETTAPVIVDEDGIKSGERTSIFSGIVRFLKSNTSEPSEAQADPSESQNDRIEITAEESTENRSFAAGERVKIQGETASAKLSTAPGAFSSTVSESADSTKAQMSPSGSEQSVQQTQELVEVEPLINDDALADDKKSSVFGAIKHFFSRLTQKQSEPMQSESAAPTEDFDEAVPALTDSKLGQSDEKKQSESQLDALNPPIPQDAAGFTTTKQMEPSETDRIDSSSIFVPRAEEKEVTRANGAYQQNSERADATTAEVDLQNIQRRQRNYRLRQSFEMPLVEGDQSANSEAPSLNEIEVIGQEMSLMLQEVMDGEDDPTKRLPIDPVIARAINAVETAPLFLQAQQNIETYRAIRDQVLAQRKPQLDGQIGYGRRSSESISSVTNEVVKSSGGYQSRSLSSSLVLFDFGSINYQAKAAESRGEATKAQVRALKSEVFLDAINAFYEVQRALLQLRLARENVNSRQAFVRYVRDRTELGASSAADVIRAESRVAEAMDLMSSAAQSLARSQAVYREFYGEEAQPYILPQEIGFDEGAFRDLESLVMMHPEMEQSMLEIVAAENDYKAALAGQNGALSLQLQASQSQSPGDSRFLNDQTMSLGFSGSLYDGGGRQAQSEQAAIALNEAKLARDILGRRILRDLRDAYAEYEGQIAAVSARRMVMSGAEDAYAISKEMYSFSRISLFELLKTQEEVFSAGQRLIDSVIERALSKYRLLYVSNRLAEVFDD